MRIDSHFHLWTSDYPWLARAGLEPLQRDVTIADVLAHFEKSSIDAAVLVEAGLCDLRETQRFLAIADTTPQIAGVVGWMSLEDPDLRSTIGRLRTGSGGRWLVGMRDQIQSRDVTYLARPDVHAALATAGEEGLAVDLVVRPDQIASAASAAAATPGTLFVLDHLGKPPFSPAGFREWHQDVARLAANDNVVAKLSGLLTEAGPAWTPELITPYIGAALDLFGPARLMIGSDWPVCELAAPYADTMRTLEDCLAELSADERGDVLGGTAARTYRLTPDHSGPPGNS